MGQSLSKLELDAHRRRCAKRLAEMTDVRDAELVGWMASAPRSVPEYSLFGKPARNFAPRPSDSNPAPWRFY